MSKCSITKGNEKKGGSRKRGREGETKNEKKTQKNENRTGIRTGRQKGMTENDLRGKK